MFPRICRGTERIRKGKTSFWVAFYTTHDGVNTGHSKPVDCMMQLLCMFQYHWSQYAHYRTDADSLLQNVLTERAWLCVRWYFHGLREGILQQIQQSVPDQMTRAWIPQTLIW
jgi:predicted metal-dependent hydrolase